jgi:dolichol-phosphate mannosyltransferase
MAKPAHDPLHEVAVVIPCYRSAGSIGAVVAAIPAGIGAIVCVNDASDDGLAEVLQTLAERHSRLTIVTHERNRGVGAATVSGYRRAFALGARIVVKIDSDGQMNPAFIPDFVAPILAGEADYVKGNRFFDIERVRQMPGVRLIGNAGLTFFSRASSGYWNLSDPTNGFTAIHAGVAQLLPLHKLHERFFFESDLLFRLNSVSAMVVEQPLEARYGDEVSNLSVGRALLTFPFLHLRNFTKRLFYNYFLRNFDVASLNLSAGLVLSGFGALFGAQAWLDSLRTGTPATAGTVMLGATPLLLGFQLLLAFFQNDIARTPREPIQKRIARLRVLITDSEVSAQEQP